MMIFGSLGCCQTGRLVASKQQIPPGSPAAMAAQCDHCWWRMALSHTPSLMLWKCPSSPKALLTKPRDVNGFHIFPDPLEHSLVPIQALQ